MFNEIKTEKDIQDFIDKTNSLHDGYIISVIYENNGIEKIESGHLFSPWMTALTLRILVTSIWDTIVEIKFECLDQWQIKDNFSDILSMTLSFNKQGHIVWADDVWKNIEELKSCSYVIAESLKWRIVEKTN